MGRGREDSGSAVANVRSIHTKKIHGVFAEMLVARKSEAGSIARSENPIRDWLHIVCKRLDELELVSDILPLYRRPKIRFLNL